MHKNGRFRPFYNVNVYEYNLHILYQLDIQYTSVGYFLLFPEKESWSWTWLIEEGSFQH